MAVDLGMARYSSTSLELSSKFNHHCNPWIESNLQHGPKDEAMAAYV